MSFIYALLEPENGEIRYIGKTDNPNLRYAQHLDRERFSNHHKSRWILSLLRKGLYPIMEIVEECDSSDVGNREIFWIAYYRNLGKKLTNMADGGIGGNTLTTEEIRDRHSKNTSAGLKGKKKSSEHIRNRVLALVGKLHTEEHKRKIGDSVRGALNGFYGKSHTDDTKEKIRLANIEYANKIKSEQGKRFTDEQLVRMSARFRKIGKYYGVSKLKSRWRCRTYKDGKEIRFGTFDTQEEAAMAWDENIRKYFPEAPLNFYEGETSYE